MMDAVWFVLGLVALIAGAEALVFGASGIALSLGIPPVVVGLTVVALGTSAPEIAVAVGASWNGDTGIALGNVVGSNVFNLLFVLGLSALVTPIAVPRQIVRQEIPIMLGATALLVLVVQDGALSPVEGMVLLGILVAWNGLLMRQSLALPASEAPPVAPSARLPVLLLAMVVGLALLVQGAEWLVGAAVAFASALGVSDVVIGLTVVAAGTSMPEVATSVMAGLRGQRELAVGNVVGSNTFNLLGCLGGSAVAAGGVGLPVPATMLSHDLWVLMGVSVAALPICMTGREVTRWEGAVLLFYYACYTAWLVLDAQGSGYAPAFSTVVVSYLVPMTAFLLVGLMVAEVRADRAVAVERDG